MPMTRSMRPGDVDDLALSVALMAIAGCVDAIGFLKLGHLFVSFMSGNTTQFVVWAIPGSWDRARAAGALVVLFVLGVIAGRFLGAWALHWRRPAILLLDGALLSLAALMPPTGVAMIVPMVLAMGIQNAALHRAGGAKMSLTYVTGTLVSFGEKLADACMSSQPHERWAWLPYLLLWVGLMLGAAAGALTYRWVHLHALFLPAAAVLLLTVITAGSVRRDET